MKIYMDVCCYSRPFDNQENDRIHIEAEAILSILNRASKGEWKIVSSEIVEFEISHIIDFEKKERILILSEIAKEKIIVNSHINERAHNFEKMGFKPVDALHIACAEEKQVDIFLTTDDRLLSRARRYKNKINIRIENPVKWLMEVIENER